MVKTGFIGILFLSLLLSYTAGSLIDITQPGDPVKGIANNNDWPLNQAPPCGIDDNINTKYLHFRRSTSEITGLCVTPSLSGTPVTGFTVITAEDHSERDPVSFILYGSNTSIDGPYTVIASGTIDELNQPAAFPRNSKIAPILFSNEIIYNHYQILFPDVRNNITANSMQIAELELLGSPDGVPPIVDAGSSQMLILPRAKVTLQPDIQLFGSIVIDDVDFEWQLESGPDEISVEDLIFEPNRYAFGPQVTFPAAGMYVLSLTASTSLHTVSDTMVTIVSESLCPPADLNRDCRVDTADLLIIAEAWLSTQTIFDAPDLDGENDGVGLSDFAILAENWALKGPSVVISEFMAVNSAKYPPGMNEILDEDNDSSDWIELCNVTDHPVNLQGWYLTDDETDLTQWQFPELILQPEEFCIIFASNKNRRTPGEPLHTNFALSSDPEFLALVAPDGHTIVHHYNYYPPQYGLLSYGLAGTNVQTVQLVAPNDPAVAHLPTNDSLGLSWTAVDFNPAGWLTGTTGIGYERDSNPATSFTPWIGLDVGSMYDTGSTAYIRIPFEVDDLTGLRNLVFSIMYDDGFVAYLNGTQIAAANAPAVPAWNSSATDKHNDYDALQYVSFPLSDDVLGYLRKGQNVLAIHGLNENNRSSDFLILPRLDVLQDQSLSIVSLVEAYFPNPTPGTKNSTGQMNLGPLVRNVTNNPTPPSAAEDLVITAEVTQTRRPVSRADMVYRIGFGEEVTVAMQDDGQGADASAQDSIFTAVIPASAYAPGDMIRWYVRAFDSQDIETRAPLYLLEENSPRYFGTVAANPAIQTNLPVFQYFLQDLAAAALVNGPGTRCSVFYLNEFYDNVFIRRRGGNTTNGRKFEFNDAHHFLFDPQYARVDEINLNEKGLDPTYIRPLLSFPTYAEAGVPGSLVAPWHVIRNNNYLDVRIFVEQPDKDFLRREGLDVNGAFYKVYSDLNAELTGDEQVERKKTRLDEDNSDYIALRMGIAPANPNRNIYLFDNVNVPAVISYMAASVLVHENDHTHKNYYLYRDTENTGEWMFIPWDKDLTFGLNNSIPGIIADQDWPSDPLRSPSHPFYGTYYHRKIQGNWNRLFDAIITDPVARQMYLRRLRTLMDTCLQPPGTPANELLYEKQIDEWTDLLANELNSSDYLNNINLMKTQYLQVRRHHLYVNHLHGSTWPDDPAQIPDAQPAQFSLQIGDVDANPASWNQDEEYIEIINPNAFAADISGWTVEDAVEHTFPGGTVIPAGGSLYLTPNALAFRNRATAPTGGQHLFVQGNYKGHLSNWGETITIYDTQRNVAASKTYIGNPTDAQRYLRITEIMYHPLDDEDFIYPDEDYEYLELTNIAAAPLPLDGITFTDGIYYQFPDGLQLGAGEYLLLAKNPAAFALRYTVPQGTQILGGYDGNLSNSGERLKLEDHTHSTILDFTYNDKWYDITDGLGFSLVFCGDLHASPDTWDNKASWRASMFIGGSPGTAEQGLAPNSIVFNELLAHSHGSNDWIELFNKTDLDINISGWFLTDDNSDLTAIRKYEIPAGTVLPKNGYLLFSQETSFGSSSQPAEKRFALSEGGETVYLYSGLDGDVTGYYYTSQKFDASETGVTLGRFEKASLSGGYDFVPMITPTPLAANSGPRIPDIVMTEMMVAPPAGADDEYVELLNRSGSSVILMTLADTEVAEGVTTTEWLPWRINGIGYTFEEYVVLAPGEKIIVARNLAAFDAAYGSILPAGTRVFGPYGGKLDNSGENIQLQIPGDQEWGKNRFYIPIEKVEYSNEAPWPDDLDSGASLTRINAHAYGDDPENWQTASPSPGQ
jgi:hypothetical protein